ncbi:MAG: alpha/beta hydrolase, partial [Candidatus Cloacimonetes bacterium]|nr:alpha/beta hydrolase [Candidatus Cloacimonadota bacterium]
MDLLKTRSIVFKAAVIIFLVALTTNNLLWAENDDDKITIGEQLTIKSEVLDEERQMLVYLPAGYEGATTEYPVLYLLDGGYHFHHVTGIVQFLSSQGLMPQLIVVAIKNVDRNRDFLPTHIERVPTSGGAEKFLAFITDELIPYIESNFRTQPYRILVGHSYGGVFSTYTFLEKPDTFNSYITISPYLHWDEQLLVKQAETALKPGYSKNKCFYMTLGDEPPYIPAIEKFISIIETESPDKLEFTYVQMIEETHGSIPHLSIYHGLENIYSDWVLPKEKYEEDLTAIDNHYKYISEKYNYDIQTPEYVINFLGYNYLIKEEIEKAIEVFQENIKRFPESANVY